MMNLNVFKLIISTHYIFKSYSNKSIITVGSGGWCVNVGPQSRTLLQRNLHSFTYTVGTLPSNNAALTP